MKPGGYSALYKKNMGFTLLDTLVGVTIFLLVGIVVFQAYTNLLKIMSISSERVAASSILQEEIEQIRNIPFTDIGLSGGIPPGNLEQTKTISRNGKNYLVTTIIRNVDDEFDGVLGNELDDIRLPYSAQVGAGGLTIENNCDIYGNIFSNGNINGQGLASVSGDVWLAKNKTLNHLYVGGEVHSETIIDANIGGNAYYLTISGSTVGGNQYPGTPGPDPQPLPILDADIAEWKSVATAGGSTGSVSLGKDDEMSLGPIKINGDLDINLNGILTLTGTVWVTGNVHIKNDGAIVLDSSYSSASGVLIMDGEVDLENNAAGCGSEGYNSQKKECNTHSGSYVVFVSTNTKQSSSDPAIDVNNTSAFTGILYANNGLIYITNGAELSEATGYAVHIANGASITYGTGLYNLLITQDPGIGDTISGDYKLIEFRIQCLNCLNPTYVSATTTIAPQGLETGAGFGSLIVQVFDAVGQPVQDATVNVVNTTTDPLIDTTDVTDTAGRLVLINVPPAEQSYEITVTKDGHSQDQTYPLGEPSNPAPLKPHATVVEEAGTQVSFFIDELSEFEIYTLDAICTERSNVDFDLTGAKLIGQIPDVLKYSQSHQTGGSGYLNLSSMEWDTYSFNITDSSYYLAGSLPSLPVQLSPDATETVSLIMAPQTTNALLVEVIDAVSRLPVEGALVAILGPGYTNSLITGEGHWQQTDWSGGGGQQNFTDETRYFSSNGNIETLDPVGELKLEQTGGVYESSGTLVSSTFDNATTTNFYHLNIRPQDQPIETGNDPVRVQIATNSDNASWDFLGPDGTNFTYYTPADTTLHTEHTDDRYLRYRVELHTEDTDYTPNISDIAISFAQECTPSGQVYFNDVNTGQNTITTTKSGYIDANTNYSVVSGWQSLTIELTPQ